METSRTKISYITDYTFLLIATFIVTKILLSYLHIFSNINLIFLSIIFAIIVFLCVLKINKKTHIKNQLKTSDKKLYNDTFQKFALMSNNDIQKFFENILSKNHKTTSHKSYFTTDDNSAYFCFFEEDTLSMPFLKKAITTKFKQKIYNIYIFCINFDKLLLHFAENINEYNITFINSFEIFSTLKKHNVYPQPTLSQKTNLNKKSNYFVNFFNRANAKKFFFAGISLYLFAFLSRTYSTYYIIFASLCLIICVATFFIKDKTKEVPQKNIIL